MNLGRSAAGSFNALLELDDLHGHVRLIMRRGLLSLIHLDVNCLIGAEAPNVKDEPRPWLARRVRHDDFDSVVSFRSLVR